jgi:hypothetical protein
MATEITSKIAKDSQELKGNLQRVREVVLDYFNIYKYGTKTQIAFVTGLAEEQIHKRLSELKAQGYIYDSVYAERSKKTNELQKIWCMNGYLISITTV